MSKFQLVINILDKFVWMLLVTSVTTQALQIAGVVDSPKALGEITYNQDNEYSFGLDVEDADTRGKRQTPQAPIIENIFNVPIATLTAVSTLVQSTRPAFERLREHAMRQIEAANAAAAAANANRATTRVPRHQHHHIGTHVPIGTVQKGDAASSKVLLNV